MFSLSPSVYMVSLNCDARNRSKYYKLLCRIRSRTLLHSPFKCFFKCYLYCTKALEFTSMDAHRWFPF
uniref:Uncharacterized protein n=1 Tax=Anguilla anguilla TaxID=7936 RepID=A0A0E9P711_ANGAN